MLSGSTPPRSEETGPEAQLPAASSPSAAAASSPPTRRSWRRLLVLLVVGVLLAWLAAAYFALPLLWRGYARSHPSLEDIPGITYTANDIPGDPINVALIGTEEQVIQIMLDAKWDPADPITLKSSLKIAADTVFRRPDVDAPVSSLYLFGRKEDLAFEQPVGHDPRHRHHVRFWKSDKVDPDDRPVWVGSVTYDKGVGLSHTTGQITHHIAADVDAERDRLFEELERTGKLAETYVVPDFHKVREGHNGGGDPWRTDGKLYVGVIAGQ
jgi:hypothetical protein